GLQKVIDPHVQCSCEGVHIGRHTSRVDTLASVPLPLGINHLALGSDALRLVRAGRAAIDRGLVAWEELTLSTDFSPDDAP
ncbi:hypothetical protein QMF80_37725, partial [Streptomyces sp. G-G2]|nr:hypothetical protein [Streptomyces sp. G-G2]